MFHETHYTDGGIGCFPCGSWWETEEAYQEAAHCPGVDAGHVDNCGCACCVYAGCEEPGGCRHREDADAVAEENRDGEAATAERCCLDGTCGDAGGCELDAIRHASAYALRP